MNILKKLLVITSVLGLHQLASAGSSNTITDNQNVVSLPNVHTETINDIVFTASAYSREGIVLKWNTTDEFNRKLYTIERSVNALEWKTIAIFFPGESANSGNTYNYKDTDVKGLLYYRITAIKLDGTILYSAAKKVITINDNNAVRVYRSGTNTIVAEIDPLKSADLKIAVVSMNGQTITDRTFSNQNGRVSLNLLNLQPGAYVVKTEDSSGNIEATKLVF